MQEDSRRHRRLAAAGAQRWKDLDASPGFQRWATVLAAAGACPATSGQASMAWLTVWHCLPQQPRIPACKRWPKLHASTIPAVLGKASWKFANRSTSRPRPAWEVEGALLSNPHNAAAMNPSPTSVVGTLERLSIGVSRVSIRHGSTATRYTRYRKKNHAWTGYKRGHGESIFVYNHIQNGMIVYSHDPVLKVRPQRSHGRCHWLRRASCACIHEPRADDPPLFSRSPTANRPSRRSPSLSRSRSLRAFAQTTGGRCV